MYYLLIVSFVTAFYFVAPSSKESVNVQNTVPEIVYSSTEEPVFIVQDFTTECVDSTAEEPVFVVQDFTTESVYSSTEEPVFAVQDFTTECIDITLQNAVTITQEQLITCTNFDEGSNMVYSTVTSTLTKETVSVETVVTCTNADLIVQNFTEAVSVETADCLEKNVTTYTSDVFVLNLVSSSQIQSETDFDLQHSTSTMSLVFDVQNVTRVVLASSSTTLLDEFSGDLEGLPTPVANDTLLELTIEEIPDIEVSEIRDNGLEFCNAVGLGNSLANGTQQQFETCSLTVQGAIPNIDNMVSTIIVSPENNDVIRLGTNFTITIKSINIEYGFFDDPTSLYYISPQRLNSQGIIQGHNHVAIQKLLGSGEVPSARNPLFFKGLNEASFDGTLSTEVNGDVFTETGQYRLCTSSSSQGHQPVLNPVARRFFQDDCIRFNVVN